MNNEKNFEKIVSEIKNKINILDVVQPYVILTKKGDNYWGCCPFHNEIIQIGRAHV